MEKWANAGKIEFLTELRKLLVKLFMYIFMSSERACNGGYGEGIHNAYYGVQSHGNLIFLELLTIKLSRRRIIMRERERN